MENRIDRRDDEPLYQPKIHSERIRTLYNIKQVTGKPMTVLVDQAIRRLAENYGVEYHAELPPFEEDEPLMREPTEETWEDVIEYRKFLDELDYLKCLEMLSEIKNEQGRNTD